ncbi:MAG TPA: hypothetical protein PKB03_04530, partial [Baekduia sp.]|nr:hypothetical protein [Baekduia sp.]
AAETIYLTYGGHVRARRGLVEIAAEQEHWATALARQDAVLALDEGPEEQLRRARILRSLERRDEALSLFKAVAKDIAAPIGMRSTGYRSATELLQTGDPARVIRMATDWLEVEPDADDAHWVRAWARLRACEFDEALRELGSAGIEPATLEQARLLATLLVQSHEYPDAIRRLTEISDRFERPEDLEAAVFFGALRREGELAPELTARVRETFDEFPMRFPDSKQIIAFEVPDDPAEFRRFVEDMLPDRSPAIDVERSVLAGEAPMAALADAVGKTAAEVWALSHALPLGFSHELIDNLELEDARSALGQPVVVDVSSVSVLALIDEQTSGRCLGALPASLITESALQDCVSGASTLSRADRQAGSLTRDPITGEGLFIEADPDELEERRRLLERAAVMARELQLRADTDPDSDEPLNRQLIEERAPGATSSAFRAILSTASLAKRAERPVLCDDRWLRSALRQMGVPTFGTPALLRALGERGVVLPLEVAAARAALLARGSLGLRPSAPELLDRVGPSGNASAALASLVADRFAWIHGGDARYPVLAGFLHRCWQADPAALARWVRWALNVLKNALPEEAAARHPFALLISAFGLLSGAGPVDVPFVRALIRALERCAGEFRYGDPVYLTLDVVAELTARQPPHVRAPLLGRLITMLPWSRQPDAFKRYFG